MSNCTTIFFEMKTTDMKKFKERIANECARKNISLIDNNIDAVTQHNDSEYYSRLNEKEMLKLHVNTAPLFVDEKCAFIDSVSDFGEIKYRKCMRPGCLDKMCAHLLSGFHSSCRTYLGQDGV